MMDILMQGIAEYGLIGVFIGTLLDHTGTPAVMLLSIGLAASGVLSIQSVLLVSFLGGLVGDIALYAIGFYCGKKAIDFLIRKKPNTQKFIDKISKWLEKYGEVTVFWGRFVALLGRYVSLIVGIFRYPFFTFLIYAVLGGLVLVVVFGIPFYLLGEKINNIFNNAFLSIYITFFIIILQIAISWLVYRFKKTS